MLGDSTDSNGDMPDTDVDHRQWFAIWTRSRHEQVVREQLARKGYEVFLPTITRWSRWKDRKKKIDWPLFPGYCFARVDPDVKVRRLVESELKYDPCPLIAEGAKVEVMHGPLRGVVGRLVRKGAHARLVLSVNLIGQAVSAEVDAADVRPY